MALEPPAERHLIDGTVCRLRHVEPPIGLRTFEVRWIRRGRLATDVVTWFARLSHFREERRDDDYLRVPNLAGFSIKIRGGESLDVKQRRGTVGDVELGGVASGRIRQWVKVSFTLSAGVSQLPAPAGWVRVGKHRRIIYSPIAESRSAAPESGICSVELTEIYVEDEEWWTLGFESTGPEALALAGLRDRASMVFSEPPPMRALRSSESISYSEWLQRFHR
jgi:hypothetical protein